MKGSLSGGEKKGKMSQEKEPSDKLQYRYKDNISAQVSNCKWKR